MSKGHYSKIMTLSNSSADKIQKSSFKSSKMRKNFRKLFRQTSDALNLKMLNVKAEG